MSLIDQYIRVQKEYVEKFGEKTIILCQTGSFYEVYAFKINDWQLKVANELLDLKIASKKSNNTSIYMCGFPDHATERFEKKLLKNNYSVVYMNQSVNLLGKIERKVTNVISNGSNFDSNEALIASIFFEKEDEEEYYVHLSIFDTNLGDTTVIVNNNIIKNTNEFINMFVIQYKVSELITNVPYKNDKILVHQKTFNKKKNNEIIDQLEEYFSNFKNLYIHIKDRIGFNVLLDKSIENVVNLLEFVKFHNENLVKNLKMPIIQKQSEFLEKFNGFDKIIDINSVTKLIDFCKTTEGSKKLSNIIQTPIYDINKLNKRYENIQKIISNQDIFKITDKLSKICNIDRLNRKIEIGKFEKYDITKLLKSNIICYEVLRDLREYNCGWIPSSKTLEDFQKYINKIESYFDIDKIDTLNIFKNEQDIDKICNEINIINERIQTLSKTFQIEVKIQYNEKTGFFFETSRKRGIDIKVKFKDFNYQLLTSICKISNNEMEKHSQNFEKLNKLLEIKTNEKINAFFDENYYKFYESIKKVLFKITWTDVFQSIAMASIKLNLKRPILKQAGVSSIECKDLRHILVENSFKNTKQAFVPNDVNLNSNYLIYGVNSVGKSIYLKSIGIAVILAQSGIFVPANECVLTPYNKIFARFGNADDLVRNHSSFISEIYEIETIITNCDSNSLIIADECCSSTEIKSAIEIVSSTLKWLTEKKSSFVFSSHFFELINKVKGIESLSIAYLKITETKDDIIFDRKLTIGTPENLNYGTKIAKTIFTNKNFKKMLEKTDVYKEKKIVKSRYNSSLVVKCCTICGYAPTSDTDLPLDIHHIGMQADADQNGFINNMHKNDAANLVVLCKCCHQQTHQGKITINGWKMSLHENKLDYVIK
ncbi:putative DNA mismatch repair ATPase [Aureococcus anophagefferens virus]|uniref:Putative DNA mismatch repair ATPase n=1 Tax=Aureococcus anophagefferens virus TaxID=1474867 RepID=A0A076FGT9_9VIRU|nr:putative DNA mismatch repair ATPase [Aureococcus anophagefferens virus]AII16947.1 putative DNA mismatch repair ATPase [Aureococcus anophagefferens virus]UOG94086.1 hypothetical protein MKD35_45 [Aureococcus anophagefferens virus]